MPLLTWYDAAAARAYYATGVWREETLYGALCRHAVERPGAYALRDATRRIRWAELRVWVDALDARLHAHGLRAGDRVAVWVSNRCEATVVLLACARNGYVCNPSLHQNYTLAEIVDLLRHIGARCLIAEAGHGADARADEVFAQAAQLPNWCGAIAVAARPGRPIATAPVEAFPSPTQMDAAPLPAPVTDPDKICYLAFTSGTTGKPKGVMHSDNTLLANGRAMVADWGHHAGSVVLSLSPLSHHIATVALEQVLVCGMELVINDPPAGSAALDWIAECGADYVMGVPTHAIDLLAEMQRRGIKQLGRARVFYMAGAPIPPAVARRLVALGIRPQNVYGMTENGSHQYTRPDDSDAVVTDTCGRACSGYEIKLWRQENSDLEAEPGEIGEIGGRGGVLMRGYFDNQAATEASFNRHGYFMSGDLGRVDAAGNLSIVGRKKDVIIRGGHNIFPARIEALAHRHGDILKAAAFCLPDDRLGEKVCLAIVCRAAPMEAGAVLAHLAAEGLSKYDMPEYYIALDALPLTASGKVLKRELTVWATSGRIRPAPVRWQAPR